MSASASGALRRGFPDGFWYLRFVGAAERAGTDRGARRARMNGQVDYNEIKRNEGSAEL